MGTDPQAVNRPPRSLQHIDTWLFDLDNTLYPPSCNLQQQMAAQAQQLLCDVLGVSAVESHELIMKYMHEYGTAVVGMNKLHGVTPELFYKTIHDVDYSVVKADPDLNIALGKLTGRKYIFTNGTADHAERVLARLGCATQFDAIFDIVAAEYKVKPEVAPYRTVVQALGGDTQSMALVEDVPNNLRPAAELGMTTVWVRNQSEFSYGTVDEHVHVIADNLVSWLQQVVEAQVSN